MQAIICASRSEFDALNAQIWEWMQRPENGGSKGARWTIPTIHPTDGRIAIWIDLPWMGRSLTEAQIARVETLTLDWFPAEPVEG